MADPMKKSRGVEARVDLRPVLQFRGPVTTFHVGLLAYRELDDVLARTLS